MCGTGSLILDNEKGQDNKRGYPGLGTPSLILPVKQSHVCGIITAEDLQ
jgi:hypothetical protein